MHKNGASILLSINATQANMQVRFIARIQCKVFDCLDFHFQSTHLAKQLELTTGSA